MKKLVCLVLAFASVACLASCKNESETELSYGEKYILREDINKVEAEQSYFKFYSNGQAEYHYYNVIHGYGVQVYSYTINFRYKVVEEENMVFCFYNGVEYDEADTTKSADTESIHRLMYTEDFLMNVTNANMYLTEDFVEEELPNFGK
ncbi:MAG: hypothetical protein IJ329_01270 [Clostridia bacterium]|nr:hypothetical protein [Clostridia bacterium]